MQTETIFYIITAVIVAVLIAGFQYVNKKKSMLKRNMLFFLLRFISVFSVLLLLINPKFEQETLIPEKPNLVLAIDNSESVKYLGKDTGTIELVERLMANSELNKKFDIDVYTFGETLKTFDSLAFIEKETDISQTFLQLGEIYKQKIAPTILISDGNQTFGTDYTYLSETYKQPVYPVILGDTVQYTDLKIEQLNVNRYAYLKNKFPVETILVYSGNESVSSKFTISDNGKIVHSEMVNFSKTKNSKVIHITLPANRVGVHAYKASIVPILNEKNTVNNHKNFAIEVIDQQTKIAVVSDIVHPDLGVFKKSIESNEQRSVVFLKSNELLSQLNDFQLFILYQPNNKFKSVFEVLSKENKNKWTVIGTKTDLDFLNNSNQNYKYQAINKTEKYQARLNTNYTSFLVDDIAFESFPPLNSPYGEAVFSSNHEILLGKTVNGVDAKEPLLATFEEGNRREAVLFGENIWQWRAQHFLNTQNFTGFDDFIGKVVQYLASNKLKSRLNIEYESFYNGNSNVIVKAGFFDKNYVFNPQETLNIKVTDSLKTTKIYPFVLKNNSYQVDLSRLPPSEYSFTVSATSENISKSGRFTILDYNVEQQFLNANTVKLEQLAQNSGAQSYFMANTDALIGSLLNDDRYKTIQKSHKNTLPLIDWKYLLAIIIISLAIEWFLRKYNGLI
ncbi:MAG: VWA domain-containing protein [Aestuariibaculum sp.]